MPAIPVPHSHSVSIVMLFVQYKHFGWLYVITLCSMVAWTSTSTHTHTLTDGWTHTNLHNWPQGFSSMLKSVYWVMRQMKEGTCSLQGTSPNKLPLNVFMAILMLCSIILLPSLSLCSLKPQSWPWTFIHHSQDLMCGSPCLWRHWLECVSRPNVRNVNTHSLHSPLQRSHPRASQILPYRVLRPRLV